MGEARTCVILLFVVVQTHLICTQPIFESFFCDLLCDDDDSSDYDFCDGCSSSSNNANIVSSTEPTSMKPSQNISIKIPASQGTILGILNTNGMWTVNVDAQGGGTPGASPSTTTAAASTAETTTAAAKRK